MGWFWGFLGDVGVVFKGILRGGGRLCLWEFCHCHL